MSVSSVTDYVGPIHPWDPLGEPVQLHEGLVAQDYEDGTLIQISAKPGTPVVVYPLPAGGLWQGVFEEESTSTLFVSIWYPQNAWHTANQN